MITALGMLLSGSGSGPYPHGVRVRALTERRKCRDLPPDGHDTIGDGKGDMLLNVTDWLRGLGLEQYAHSFHENDVDAKVLPELGRGFDGPRGPVDRAPPQIARRNRRPAVRGTERFYRVAEATGRCSWPAARHCRAATADGDV